MENFKRGQSGWQMLELPDGITTSNGNWYHITSKEIDQYVPGLLKEYPLEEVVKEADAWMKSADILSLLLYFVLVYVSVDPLFATLSSLLLYFIWYFNTGFFINLMLTPVIKLLTKDGVIYTLSALLLIGISFQEKLIPAGIEVEFNALWYGLALFFVYKVGLLRLSIQYLKGKMKDASGVPIQDRILNMLLIKKGLKHGILTGTIKKMRNDLIEVANYHKTKKK